MVVEGNEATLITPTTLTRITNVTQINQKSVAVSGTQDAVDKAGMAKELAYRVILHTKEIKRDRKLRCCRTRRPSPVTPRLLVA